MKFWNILGRFLTFLCVVMVTTSTVHAEDLVAIPAPSDFVVDEAKWLNSQELLATRSAVRAINQKGKAQIAVLIVDSVKPEAIEQYSMRVAEKWKIGKKQVDNGVLIVIARQDRKIRIDVGYGLEGIIPDLVTKQIIDENLSPHLKNNDPLGAITTTVERITSLTDKDVEVKTEGTSETLSITNIPFFGELTDAGQVTTLVLGVIGGILLLIGVYGESGWPVMMGLVFPPAVGLLIGLIFFTAQCLLVAAVSFLITIAVALGISVGGVVISGGGKFGGGGASGDF